MDWNRVFELAVAGAPAVSVLLAALFVVWMIVRVFKGLARLLKGKPAELEPETPKVRRTGRIEPVLGPVEDKAQSQSEETKSFDDLAGAVVSLGLRVDALERQIASLKPGGAQQKRGFRIIDGVASTPSFEEVGPVKRH